VVANVEVDGDDRVGGDDPVWTTAKAIPAVRTNAVVTATAVSKSC
jgi:hypothetical protein